METQIPAISHHHDFYWERVRFSIGAVSDYLDMAFRRACPMCVMLSSTAAQEQLALRKGISSTVVPNVFRFEESSPEPDDYSADLREEQASNPTFLFFNPLVWSWKGIEHSIKLLSCLEIQGVSS